MPFDKTNHLCAAELEQAIERQIVQRTWGRIHRLQVEVLGDRIVVHGLTQSYCSKQLALEGVLDVLGAAKLGDVELDILVAPGSFCATKRPLADDDRKDGNLPRTFADRSAVCTRSRTER